MMLFSKKFGISIAIFLAACALMAQPVISNAHNSNEVTTTQENNDLSVEETEVTLKEAYPSVSQDADIDANMFTKQLSDSGATVIKIGSTSQALKYLQEKKSIFSFSRNLPIRISAVDNSKLKYFPEIQDQGSLGSCTAWASVYYQMSYNVNKALNRDGKLKENTFSPTWVYNMVNEGENIGTYYSDVLAVLSEIGAVSSVSVEPQTTDMGVNIKDVHATKENFIEASNYKVSEFYNIELENREYDTLITCNTDVDIDVVKKALALGEVLTATTYSDNWNRQTIEANEWNKANDDFVGETIITRCDGEYYGSHRITIVGYNDDIWVDINQNGCVEKAEKGAFKIANSWGTSFDNNGFVWMSYDAINRVSAVEDSENVVLKSDLREAGLFDIIGFKVDVDGSDNDVFLNVDMATDNAGEVALKIIARKKGESEIIGEYDPIPFMYSQTYQNLDVNAFDGTYNEYAEGNFYIDLSNVVEGLTKDNLCDYDFEFIISDSYEDASSLKVNKVKLYIKSTDSYLDTALDCNAQLNYKALNIKYGSENKASLTEAYEPEAVG